MRSSPSARKAVSPPWARDCSSTSRSDRGVFFQIRVDTPWMSMSSISKNSPGAVSVASISAYGGMGTSEGVEKELACAGRSAGEWFAVVGNEVMTFDDLERLRL